MYYSIQCIYHILFIHLLVVNGLDIVNNTATNIGPTICFHKPKSRITVAQQIYGWYFEVVWNNISSSSPILHIHQHCIRVPIHSHPHQHLLFCLLLYLFKAILAGGNPGLLWFSFSKYPQLLVKFSLFLCAY